MFEVGDKIELITEVKGCPIGTKGEIKEINPDGDIVMDLMMNDAVLVVKEPEIKKI